MVAILRPFLRFAYVVWFLTGLNLCLWWQSCLCFVLDEWFFILLFSSTILFVVLLQIVFFILLYVDGVFVVANWFVFLMVFMGFMRWAGFVNFVLFLFLMSIVLLFILLYVDGGGCVVSWFVFVVLVYGFVNAVIITYMLARASIREGITIIRGEGRRGEIVGCKSEVPVTTFRATAVFGVSDRHLVIKLPQFLTILYKGEVDFYGVMMPRVRCQVGCYLTPDTHHYLRF